ncbi:MAG: insulinase family protein [Planctomycetota bacterium]|nr:MAG: insulinase family protein [Planctomycetota bacterium]
MSEVRFVQERLANGLRVVIEIMPHVQSAACGFLSRTGARDDPAEMAGVSHFLEHMCFKGTATRSWENINIEFDEMGAQYNAYTSKDRTFYYSWGQTKDLDRQMELLSDMMRSILPVDEFEMEKKVVLEEIAMSNDDLPSNAYDFLYESLCAGSSLSWPVLGYDATIGSMGRDQMYEYFKRRYAPGNMILFVAGNVDPDKVLVWGQRFCGCWEAVTDTVDSRKSPRIHNGVAVRTYERFHQQALILAFPSTPATHPLDETAGSVAAILGGVNSRFYWNIMQKGLSTRAGVYREDYADFAVLVMYGLCEPENCEKLLAAMRQEAGELVGQGPQAKEIQRVKNLRRTSLATESEAPFYRLSQLVDDVDYYGTPRPAEERLAAVDAVSSETIGDYFSKYPITGEGLLVSVGPRDWPRSE